VHNVTPVIYIDRSMCPACGTMPRGLQMDWGFIACLVIATLAILGVLIEIPIISDYAFLVSCRRLSPARWHGLR
jgi:hypothetical protein